MNSQGMASRKVPPIMTGILGAILAMTVFWLSTMPRPGEDGLGPRVNSGTLSPQGALPPVAITTLDGTTITSAELEGKVAVFYFWGTTCPPCVAGMPALRDAWRSELSSLPELALVSLASDSDVRTLERFIQGRGIEWPVAANVDPATHAVWGALKVEYTPTTVIVDPAGQIVWTGSKIPANLPAIVAALTR